MDINHRKAFCKWVNALDVQAKLVKLPSGCKNLQ